MGSKFFGNKNDNRETNGKRLFKGRKSKSKSKVSSNSNAKTKHIIPVDLPNKILNNVLIGTIPIMIGSKYCMSTKYNKSLK